MLFDNLKQDLVSDLDKLAWRIRINDLKNYLSCATQRRRLAEKSPRGPDMQHATS